MKALTYFAAHGNVHDMKRAVLAGASFLIISCPIRVGWLAVTCSTKSALRGLKFMRYVYPAPTCFCAWMQPNLVSVI